MKNRGSLNKFLNRDRKTLYMVLSVLALFVFALTIVYAALSTTLQINGNAEVTAASWDIHLDNVQLNSGSATTSVPVIIDSRTATFSTALSKPGDYYMFTIDVVNNGSIDAMIDSVTKTPELTDMQKKYLNYVVEYQNGESITTKQLVEKNSFVRLKVKVEFRKDVTASALPTSSETLNLSFKVNYVQSDDSNENITIDNNGKLIKIVSGDYNTVGSEICIGEECFYVISSDEDSVTMLAKYNLHVGNRVDGSWNIISLDSPTGIQDGRAIGWFDGFTDDNQIIGATNFSTVNYWYGNNLKVEYSSGYPAYVYDSNSRLYNYVENYKIYLESQGVTLEEIRLIKSEELEALGCSRLNDNCSDAPEWLYATSYWSGSANINDRIIAIFSDNRLVYGMYDDRGVLGVRPVIVIKV